jgi:hypothetical protein
MRRGRHTHREENVVVEEVTGETLDLFGERCRKHKCLAFSRLGHPVLFDNPTNLGLEPHIKHAVCLIEHQVAHAVEADNPSLHQIDQPTWCCNE